MHAAADHHMRPAAEHVFSCIILLTISSNTSGLNTLNLWTDSHGVGGGRLRHSRRGGRRGLQQQVQRRLSRTHSAQRQPGRNIITRGSTYDLLLRSGVAETLVPTGGPVRRDHHRFASPAASVAGSAEAPPVAPPRDHLPRKLSLRRARTSTPYRRPASMSRPRPARPVARPSSHRWSTSSAASRSPVGRRRCGDLVLGRGHVAVADRRGSSRARAPNTDHSPSVQFFRLYKRPQPHRSKLCRCCR